jgi:putative PIN family toxin of toxin-antitoxin system
MDADYKLYTCEQVAQEILDVLNRPKIRSRFPHITDAEIRLVSLLLDQAHHVEVKPEEILPICRDPKDDMFLACAKVANADYLVSEDNDLLVIGQHHATKIVNIIDFLSVLQQQQTPPTPES